VRKSDLKFRISEIHPSKEIWTRSIFYYYQFFFKKSVAKISVKSFEIFKFDRFENARKKRKKSFFFQSLKTFFA